MGNSGGARAERRPGYLRPGHCDPRQTQGGRQASNRQASSCQARGRQAGRGAEAAQKPKAAPKPAADKKTVDKKEAEPPTDGKAAREKTAGKKDNKKNAKEKADTTGSAAAGAPKPPGIRETYLALPHTERLALQFNLTWAGDYRGAADGEFSDKLAEAIKDYQKRNKFKVTGLLSPEERTTLAAAVAPRQREAGWQMTEDPATGARVGIPAKYATRLATGPAGSRWSSEQGQLQIETFRVETGATLEAVFEQQKSLPRRRITGSNLGPEAFTSPECRA